MGSEAVMGAKPYGALQRPWTSSCPPISEYKLTGLQGYMMQWPEGGSWHRRSTGAGLTSCFFSWFVGASGPPGPS